MPIARLEAALTIGFYIAGTSAIGGGLAFALSPSWGSVAVGSILLGTLALTKFGGRKE